MHSQPKNVGQKPGCPKRKGSSQCKKKPNVDRYVDPFCTLQSSNEPHGSTSSQTTSISDNITTDHHTIIIIPLHPLLPAVYLHHNRQSHHSIRTATSANMNTLIVAAITQFIQPTSTNQINLNSSYQFPFNASQTQQSTQFQQ